MVNNITSLLKKVAEFTLFSDAPIEWCLENGEVLSIWVLLNPAGQLLFRNFPNLVPQLGIEVGSFSTQLEKAELDEEGFLCLEVTLRQEEVDALLSSAGVHIKIWAKILIDGQSVWRGMRFSTRRESQPPVTGQKAA